MRLNGAQSTRALLGLGWADAAQNHYEAALTPWLELRDRNLLDAAVQEAYLAVPYAFAKLGANGQAADYYEQALTSFTNESGRIDESIGRIRDGQLMKNLLGETDGKTPQRGWFWQMQELPDAPESRYLYPILAGNDFQEGLKNYRDMAFLGSTLERWDENMIVYNDMIEAREKAYAERIPKVDALLASDAVGTMAARREAIEGRFNEVVEPGGCRGPGNTRAARPVAAHRTHRSRDCRGSGQCGTGGAAGEAAPDQGRAVLGPAQFRGATGCTRSDAN